MEAYRDAHYARNRTSHLSKLYSDVKRSAVTSIDVKSFLNQQEATAQFAALHRKFRIQKDRLVTWGLEWSDEEKGAEASIDEHVARAGLTETVQSVLANVKEVTDELEKVRSGVSKPGEKFQPSIFDEGRYGDLLNDLTASIDTLYDLSRSRRALARGEHPTFGAAPVEPLASKSQIQARNMPSSRRQSKLPSIADSELTLVNPSAFSRPIFSPYAGLPPRISATALRLPQEGPPPYEALGIPMTSRGIARIIRDKIPETVQNAMGSDAAEVPVLIEYADFDQTFQDTGVPPPLSRLEALSKAFPPMRPESQSNVSLLGYFEDTRQARIGLVYDLPYSVQNRMLGSAVRQPEALEPLSLFKMLQKTTRTHPTPNETEAPPLEVRFKLALRLTEQLYLLHLQEFPHGNINSSSVLFAAPPNESTSGRVKQLPPPMWSSFDIFSNCTVDGVKRAPALNIYKHPEDSDQSTTRDLAAETRFDLYSFALLLVEIGLWTPLGDFYKTKYSPADFKLRIERLWIPKLAARCGSAYMRAVQACIRHVDAGELSSDGIYGYMFDNLRKCCALDEEVESSMAAAPFQSPLAELSAPQSVSGKQRSSSFASPFTPAEPVPSGDLNLRQQPSKPVIKMPGEPLDPSALIRHPSLDDFKRRVTQIQRQWRRYQSWLRDIQTVPEEKDTSLRTPQEQRTRSFSHMDVKSEPRPKRQKSGLVEFPFLAIPKAIQDDWNNGTAVELGRLVNRALQGSRESCSINLTSFGENLETARPTYVVTCASTQIVKAVLKRHFTCDTSACYVRVQRGKITRCRKTTPISAANKARRSMAPRFEEDWDAENPDYQAQPVCGASIGAYKDEHHLPPVSFGGVVTIDGKSFGMSVHHMLEGDEEEDEEEESDEDDEGSDTSSVLSLDDNPEPLLSDDGSTVREPSIASDLSFDEEAQTEGDVGGIAPGEGADIEITQPALDDAISQDLHAEPSDEESGEDSGVDEDHILSYKLGQVHASSGLKRSATQGTEAGYRGISASLPQEIDWALFELLPPRVQPYNVIKGGSQYCDAPNPDQPDCYPIAVKLSSELAGAKVHCLGRTSGLASGVISSTMELLRLHGRTTFSASWTVHGGFGVGGDSGAWVVSSDGQVCGHVLAERAGRTYICPMDLLFDDIKTTLGASQIDLPIPAGIRKGGWYIHDVVSETAVSEAVAKLRLQEGEVGGVPVGYASPSVQEQGFDVALAPLQSAGKA